MNLTLEEVKQEKARRKLVDFTTYTKPDYYVNWHHEALCNILDAFLEDPDFIRLMIFMPPRHGKSEIVSRRLPAYALGKNPDLSIMGCSYAADLTQRMNRDVQRIIDNKKYSKLFPNTGLSSKNIKTTSQGSYLRNSDAFEIVDYNGSYRGAGVGGAITGMGFNIGIIDDPVKNWKEANSPTFREAVWEWYGSTFYTRAERNAKILITLTRWHEDDLAGRLIRQMEDNPEAEQWHILNFPAIFEGQGKYTSSHDHRADGEALWPWKYNEKKLEKIKTTIGSYLFSALYQQSPSPSEGGIFQRSWWKFYQEIPERFDEIIQSWDCAFKDTKTSDYVVGQVWGRIGANKYLLDQIREKLSFPETLQSIRNLSWKWKNARSILIEDKANGPAVISILQQEISGIIAVNPEGGKIVRAQAVSPDIESGNVFLPVPSKASWVQDFIEECSAFPSGKFDDQVDAMTQALNRLYSRSRGMPSVISRPGVSSNMTRGFSDYNASDLGKLYAGGLWKKAF